MEKARVSKDMTIKLPMELKGFVSEGDEFVVSIIGDSFRFKKIKAPDLLDLAAAKKDDTSPDIDEISRIVHKIRGVDED